VARLKLLGIKNTNPNSKSICVYRGCGGYGDVLNMRLIFEDLKNLYKDYSIDWCLPYSFLDAAASHPFVSKVISLQDYNKSNYKYVFDLTTACTKYEWKHKINNKKNRAEIWANHIGFELKNAFMYMPIYNKYFEEIKQDLVNFGWDKNKKIVLFCPYSAIQAKNLTHQQILTIKDLTKNFFLIALHNKQCEYLKQIKVPCISNYSLKKSMALTKFSNYVISTDTGHLHCSGGYNKPTMGLFCYTSGNVICKYYKSIIPVQEENLDCGPCYLYTSCKKSNDVVKPCRINISSEQIKKSWQKLLNLNI
jgi:ADP-heptose:LPS heptosyltransferase